LADGQDFTKGALLQAKAPKHNVLFAPMDGKFLWADSSKALAAYKKYYAVWQECLEGFGDKPPSGLQWVDFLNTVLEAVKELLGKKKKAKHDEEEDDDDDGEEEDEDHVSPAKRTRVGSSFPPFWWAFVYHGPYGWERYDMPRDTPLSEEADSQDRCVVSRAVIRKSATNQKYQDKGLLPKDLSLSQVMQQQMLSQGEVDLKRCVFNERKFAYEVEKDSASQVGKQIEGIMQQISTFTGLMTTCNASLASMFEDRIMRCMQDLDKLQEKLSEMNESRSRKVLVAATVEDDEEEEEVVVMEEVTKKETKRRTTLEIAQAKMQTEENAKNKAEVLVADLESQKLSTTSTAKAKSLETSLEKANTKLVACNASLRVIRNKVNELEVKEDAKNLKLEKAAKRKQEKEEEAKNDNTSYLL
jgi:hypothetical protein